MQHINLLQNLPSFLLAETLQEVVEGLLFFLLVAFVVDVRGEFLKNKEVKERVQSQ